MFNVNVKSAMNVTQVVAEDMKNRKAGGSIVNLSSQVCIMYIKRFNVCIYQQKCSC